jgi:hypothetical protein
MKFRGKNNINSTKELIDERIKYKLDGLFDGEKAIDTNIVDFNFSDRVYYGRINSNYNSVFPDESKLCRSH